MTSEITESGDDRFSKVTKDPRFWEMPSKEHKVKIDKRFQSMFHDKRFQLKSTVDKRGRPVNYSSSEDLKRFYQLSDSDQSDEDEVEEQTKKTKQDAKNIADKQARDDDDETDKSEDDLSEKPSKKLLKVPKKAKPSVKMPEKGVRVFEEDEDVEDDVNTKEGSSEASIEDGDDDDDEDTSESEEYGDSEPDLARGKGNIETSSDDDDDDDDVDLLFQEKEEIEHNWGEIWKDAVRTDDISRRLAVCNMDWDRIKARDLLVLFNSFKPKGGVVLSVTIYPSEFGKERSKMEQIQGPLELISLPENPDANIEQQRIYTEKEREYQFKRLQYYYAVVECDTAKTAASIYEECDSFEYESSASKLDLRFIPDDMTFDDKPKDSATDVDYASYRPKLFTSAASTTAKVGITWDETDHDRVTALCRKFTKDELFDLDFKAYLASSSEEEEEPETQAENPVKSLPEENELSKGRKNLDQINKYKEILKSIQDKEKKKDEDMDMEVTWVPGLQERTEKLIKNKMEGKDQLTPWEQFLEKKKEKRREKRKEKKMGRKEVEEESVISDDELPDDVDLNDPFFSEELGLTQYLKTKKSKKGNNKEQTAEEEEEMKRQRAQMELLMADDDEGEHQHFNYDKIVEHQNLSKKKKKKLLKSNTPLEADEFKVDVKDPRFQAMFTSHLYNLDPSNPAYKKTKGTQSIIEEKFKRRLEEQQSHEEALKSKPAQVVKTEAASTSKVMDSNLSMLIKSIKSKTEQFQARKKQKTK